MIDIVNKNIHNLKILVVNGKNAGQIKVSRYLKELSLNTIEVESGEKVIVETVKNSAMGMPFDVVILDSKMQEVNAYVIAKAIKTIALTKATKLLLTSSPDEIATDEVFDLFLPEAFEKEDLFRCISSIKGLNADEEQTENISTAQISAKKHNFEILIADDHIINQNIAAAILKSKGFECDIVSNGEEAYSAVMNKEYDIVFMDCNMPIMDGYEVTRKIRDSEADKRHTRIIAMTADAMKGTKEKCIGSGMDDYISKPINFEKMLRFIQQVSEKTNTNE